MKEKSKEKNRAFAFTILFLALTYAYMWPGSALLFEGSKDKVLSDGTDLSTTPFVYGIVAEALRSSPLDMFTGALPTQQINAPEGSAIWFFWLEKFSAGFASFIFPLEQISSALAFFFLCLNGFAMYFLGRKLGWNKALSYAAAIAWAFSAYTRARIRVHTGLAEIAFLPFLFLAILQIKEAKVLRDLIRPSLGFLFVAISAQYYVIICALILPFLIWYLFIDLPQKDLALVKQRFLNVFLSSLPAVLLLLYTLLMPVRPGAIANTQVIPQTGQTAPGELHPFVNRFGSRPVDFFTGDLMPNSTDFLLPRNFLNHEVLKNLGDSNLHERTNGIRWSLWVLAGFFVFSSIKKTRSTELKTGNKWFKEMWVFWLSLAIYAFLISLKSEWFGVNIGPSALLQILVNQYRVPSRAGIIVHFAILILAASWLNQIKYKKKWVYSLVMILELPPIINQVPIVPVLPQHVTLEALGDVCGTGMRFPYVSNQWQLGDYYYFLQSMRGTKCNFINSNSMTPYEQILVENLSLNNQMATAINTNDTRFSSKLTNAIQCSNLNWIVFDKNIPFAWKSNLCNQLGWKVLENDVCWGPPSGEPIKKDCFR